MRRTCGGLAVELDDVVCGNEMLSCATNKTNIMPMSYMPLAIMLCLVSGELRRFLRPPPVTENISRQQMRKGTPITRE